MNELRPQTRFELELVTKVNTLEQLNETLLLATTAYQVRMMDQLFEIERLDKEISALKTENKILLGRLEFAQQHVHVGKTKVAGVDFPKGYEPPADFFGEGVA